MNRQELEQEVNVLTLAACRLAGDVEGLQAEALTLRAQVRQLEEALVRLAERAAVVTSP